MISERRVTFTLVLAGTAQRSALVNCAVVAYLCSFTDNHTHAVVNEQALSDRSAGVYLNSGPKAATLRNPASNKVEVYFIKKMSYPVKYQRMDTGIK